MNFHHAKQIAQTQPEVDSDADGYSLFDLETEISKIQGAVNALEYLDPVMSREGFDFVFMCLLDTLKDLRRNYYIAWDNEHRRRELS